MNRAGAFAINAGMRRPAGGCKQRRRRRGVNPRRRSCRFVAGRPVFAVSCPAHNPYRIVALGAAAHYWPAMQPSETILIVDFGSQVTQLIARRVREAGVYCEIAPFSLALDAYERLKPKGIILSGSPAGVPEEGSPRAAQELFDAGLPILGICY